MTHPIGSIGFNGNCTEAMRFDATVLEAKLEVPMSGADSPVINGEPLPL